MLPKAVGIKPRVPRTSGCIVSPKYTGNAKDATPTLNPHNERPTNTIGIFVAIEIRIHAIIYSRIDVIKKNNSVQQI